MGTIYIESKSEETLTQNVKKIPNKEKSYKVLFVQIVLNIYCVWKAIYKSEALQY